MEQYLITFIDYIAYRTEVVKPEYEDEILKRVEACKLELYE